MSQAKLRTEVGVKVLKLSQNQSQNVASLLSDAMENVQNIISETAEGLGGGFDAYA
ncbi:MAG: hypothetical protein AMXMBFR13_21810 [Phycisphaerae bacterium]